MLSHLTYRILADQSVVHTLIYFYMLVSLNVAINSYDYTLLSLLISNQFVEIKGCQSFLFLLIVQPAG